MEHDDVIDAIRLAGVVRLLIYDEAAEMEREVVFQVDDAQKIDLSKFSALMRLPDALLQFKTQLLELTVAR